MDEDYCGADESDADVSDSVEFTTPRPNDPERRSTSASLSSDKSSGQAGIIIEDAAVNISESGASRSSSNASKEPPRLLVLSNRVKFSQTASAALQPNVKMVTFKHDHCDLDGILSTIVTSVSSQKFESIALIFNCSGTSITLCGKDEKLLTADTIIEMTSVREFFAALANNHIDTSWVNARLDLLMCSVALTAVGSMITNEIAAITKVPCGMSKDLLGANVVVKRIAEEDGDRTIGSLYFRPDKLMPTASKQSMSFFEKIRTVGKGAYGSAVLYRKKDDDSLVILKEINMHDLNAAERQMALNEVKVLSMLEHPNIISYFDSFEEDGILMIEMDYADGGTLAQLLSNQTESLEERQILEMFQQMVAAIKHIHGHKILHRDLKTQNIFLTKEGVIKMGDFGISKMLTTGGKGAANTVVGTPYYISPEMCEGKPYGPKSDIWALGCILYEMACRERTFEGSNLPAVVNKIMKGVYTPVKGPYSTAFKKIVEKMLERDPAKRPSADELWTEILPSIMTKYVNDMGEDADDELGNSVDSNQSKKTMSVLYYFNTQSLALSEVCMPNKIKIKEVAVGKDHAIIVSQECMIYTYGRGTEGQLGHGDDKSRSTPVLVEALKGKAVNKACCGDGFSVFASNNGIVMTCGSADSGCLGTAEGLSPNKPKLIDTLLHVDVVSIACGTQHVAIVGKEGDVYTWGNGAHGKLGLGNEESFVLPQKVTFSEPVNVKEAFCSETGTMFLTDVGIVWACGSNKNNRLGLNNRQGFLAALKQAFNKAEVEGAKEPAVVRDLCRFMVTSINMGVNHSAVLIEGGKVVTFGRNVEGQLCSGDSKAQLGLVHVKPLSHVHSMQVGCTPLSTIVSVTNGQILLLGSRYKSPPPTDVYNWLRPGMKRQQSSDLSRSRQGSASSQRSLDRSLSQTSLCRESQNGWERQGSASSSKKLSQERLVSDMDGDSESSTVGKKSATLVPRQYSNSSGGSNGARPTSGVRQAPLESLEVQYQPTPLVNFQSEQSETVVLSGFSCHQENLFVLVETTAPPSQKKLKKRRSNQRALSSCNNFKSSASSREATDDLSNSETSEMDTTGSVPTWLRGELAEAPLYDGKPVVSKPPTSPVKAAGKEPSVLKAATRKEELAVESSSMEEEEDDDLEDGSSHMIKAAPAAWVTPEPSTGVPKKSKVTRQSAPIPASPVDSNKAQLQQEIARLKKEAETAELRMSKLEEIYNRKAEGVKQESAKEAAEKEQQLQEEVKFLRDELFSQNKKMQENFKMVLNLQEELVKMQATSQSTQRSDSPPEKPPTSKSSICLVQ